MVFLYNQLLWRLNSKLLISLIVEWIHERSSSLLLKVIGFITGATWEASAKQQTMISVLWHSFKTQIDAMHKQHKLLIWKDLATQKYRKSLELSRATMESSNIDVRAGVHLYLTSKRVESSSSSFSSLRGAISTRSAGVVIISYFRVFLIRLPDLTTLMTRHVMRAAVSTQMKITMFFRVGRCVIRDEIRDPTAVSVTLCVSSSWLMMEDEVEFNCVADEIVSGSPLTRQRVAAMKVKTRL